MFCVKVWYESLNPGEPPEDYIYYGFETENEAANYGRDACIESDGVKYQVYNDKGSYPDAN